MHTISHQPSFGPMTSEALENNFSLLVKTERKITYEVLLFIQEIDKRSHHLALGFQSLANYLIEKHHYSEGSAYRRIGAMRMLSAVPEIKTKIIDGNLTLTHLTLAQAAVVKKQKKEGTKISATDKRDLLLKIQNQSTAKTKSQLMDSLDIDLPQRKQVTYGKEETVFLNFKFTKEEFERLQECLNTMSHQAQNYQDLFIVLADKVLKSKNASKEVKAHNCKTQTQSDFAAKSRGVLVGKTPNLLGSKTPTRTTKTAITKLQTVLESRSRNDTGSYKKPRSRFIPMPLRKEIYKRDQWKCQFRAKDGRLCASQSHLQIHHIKAFAKGGLHTPENLSLRCRLHNLYEAGQEGFVRTQADQAFVPKQSSVFC